MRANAHSVMANSCALKFASVKHAAFPMLSRVSDFDRTPAVARAQIMFSTTTGPACDCKPAGVETASAKVDPRSNSNFRHGLNLAVANAHEIIERLEGVNSFKWSDT
mmetsp:Transcript_53544/g.125341  ORF Transcript_53544/g.125341 Transcript_53544/m.125341 type:complete len:107 (+) Transcript_53544:1037-1357(+)